MFEALWLFLLLVFVIWNLQKKCFYVLKEPFFKFFIHFKWNVCLCCLHFVWPFLLSVLEWQSAACNPDSSCVVDDFAVIVNLSHYGPLWASYYFHQRLLSGIRAALVTQSVAAVHLRLKKSGDLSVWKLHQLHIDNLFSWHQKRFVMGANNSAYFDLRHTLDFLYYCAFCESMQHLTCSTSFSIIWC